MGLQAPSPTSKAILGTTKDSFLTNMNKCLSHYSYSLVPMAQTAGKVALSAIYLGLGLSLIGAGAYSTIYILHKNYQFYTHERAAPTEPSNSYLNFIPGWSSSSQPSHSAPHSSNLGFGEYFKEQCTAFTEWTHFASGEAFCHDLAYHSWKEIYRPESTAAAVTFTILSCTLTTFVSSYAILGGISLLGRSFQTFLSTLHPSSHPKNSSS